MVVLACVRGRLLEASQDSFCRLCLHHWGEVELLLGVRLPPLAEHVFPLVSAVEPHPDILQAHDDWLHAPSPEDLVVPCPNFKVEVVDGLVYGVEDVVVGRPRLTLVSR